MKLSKLYENLCSYDTRNPHYDAEYDSDFEARSISCYCDNCFYGRDKLAMSMIDAYNLLTNELGNTLNEYKESVRNYPPQDEDDMYDRGYIQSGIDNLSTVLELLDNYLIQKD